MYILPIKGKKGMFHETLSKNGAGNIVLNWQNIFVSFFHFQKISWTVMVLNSSTFSVEKNNLYMK